MAGQRENASGPIFRSDDIYPNQDHDDDVRKRTKKMIEGEEEGKICAFNDMSSYLCVKITLYL